MIKEVIVVGSVDKVRVRLQNALPDEYDALTMKHKDEWYEDVVLYMVAMDGKVLWSGYADAVIRVEIEGEDDDCYKTVKNVVFK